MQLGAFDAFMVDENQRNAVKKSRFRTFLTAFFCVQNGLILAV